jgi:uncharacterized protein
VILKSRKKSPSRKAKSAGAVKTAKTGTSTGSGGHQRTARYDEKLNAVLSVSSALFAGKGFERATIRDVAQATGMSLAGLYYYFKSKEELLFHIQFRTFESLCEKLRAIIQDETDPKVSLHRMIKMHFEYFIRNINDLKICSREIESLEGDFYQKVAEKRKEYFDLTQSIFDKIGAGSGGSPSDSRLAALYLFGTLNWIYQWYRPGRDPGAEALAGQLAGIYLEGFPHMNKDLPVKRQTPREKKLRRLYSMKDGRMKGDRGWEKFPLFWFILFLSYKCTKRCDYCYSFNQVGDGSGAEMDDDTFARLLEWIPEVWKVNDVKVNAVGFLGGEPLLRTDRIRRVMDSVYKHTDGMQGFLYTNGDLIDSVNWDDLEYIQWISTNITDISIEELARRMKIIGERSNVIGQTIVATLDDKNLGRILDITRFGIRNGYRLRYQRNIYQGLDAEYRQKLLQKYHEICDELEKFILKGYDVHTTFLIDTLIPTWDDEISPNPCGKRVATVFPDGSVGPCIRNHSLKTGTIFDPDPIARIQYDPYQYDFNRYDLPDECRKCEYRTTCQGGCPNDRLALTGSTSGKSVVCEIHKEIIPRLRYMDELKKELDAGAETLYAE